MSIDNTGVGVEIVVDQGPAKAKAAQDRARVAKETVIGSGTQTISPEIAKAALTGKGIINMSAQEPTKETTTQTVPIAAEANPPVDHTKSIEELMKINAAPTEETSTVSSDSFATKKPTITPAPRVVEFGASAGNPAAETAMPYIRTPSTPKTGTTT